MSKQKGTERSKGPKPGRVLEMLTARIEGALSDSDVKVTSPDHLPDKVSGGTREVDVSLCSTVGSAEVVVIVECRDRGRPADVTWIEQVKSKRDAVGAAKAIAVASGTFSKKALAAASAYGIDARTLAQVNRGEVKRWAGAVQIFHQRVRYNNARITVVLGGTEPLASQTVTRFDELVRGDVFNARFISYAGEEGLLSPLDVVRRIQPVPAMLKAGRVTVTVPPNSSFTISDDPTMMSLIGNPPEDGSPVARQHVIEFKDGEAFFNLDGTLRSLVAVQLDFTAELDSKTQVESNTYRYSSPTGIIEVAERTMSLGKGELFLTEHRKVPETTSDASQKPPRSNR